MMRAEKGRDTEESHFAWDTEEGRFERVCAYVDMDAMLWNMRRMHERTESQVKMAAVIKADGYGHGSVPIARELENEDYVWGYAVATAEEALQLREAEIGKPILLLGYAFPYCYDMLAAHKIRPAVFTLQMAKELSEAALRTGRTVKVHIKVDTGMGRIGIPTGEAGVSFVRELAAFKGIEIEGIFTHFAKADAADKRDTMHQFARFTQFIEQIEKELGLFIPIKHCCNSAGILELPEMGMDMVRAGIALYGLWPSDEVRRDTVLLKPVLSWKSRVSYVKELEAGGSVSYGGTFTAQHRMRVATIPVGYADGYPRGLSGRGSVLICQKRCPILGRICMDQFMVDVSEVPDAEVGTEVTLLGADGNERITAEELGTLSGRFNYELVCGISRRVPRVYVKDGRVIAYKDDFWSRKTVTIG